MGKIVRVVKSSSYNGMGLQLDDIAKECAQKHGRECGHSKDCEEGRIKVTPE
jgi:hypothetical protein